MNLKIALLQIMPEGSLKDNMEKGIAACKEASERGADIALFPEMWSNGYNIPGELNARKEMAIASESEFVNAYQKLAKQLKMAIGITYLEQHEPLPRNTIALFDRNGNLVYRYAKVHTCDFGEEARLDPGDEFFVGDLETKRGYIKVGSMICYDREFPESARILMLKGAELILVPNACPMEINRLSQLRARAYENMLAIATCNYPANQPDCNGHSTVYDGVAYLPELPDARDTRVFEAGEEEGIFVVELDVDMLRRYRRHEVHGNAYRRPQKYGILLEEKVEEPFVRKDARR